MSVSKFSGNFYVILYILGHTEVIGIFVQICNMKCVALISGRRDSLRFITVKVEVSHTVNHRSPVDTG